MDPDTYQKLAARTECDQEKVASRMAGPYPADPDAHVPSGVVLMPVRLNHAVIGLTGEVGELAAAVERWLYYGHELDVLDVAEEVGDCLWYLAQLSSALGFSLSFVMEGNLRKLRARYPDRYTDAQAAERDLTAERRALTQPVAHTPEAAPASWRPPLASAARLLDLAEAAGRMVDGCSVTELTLQAGFRGVTAHEIDAASDWMTIARRCIEIDRQGTCPTGSASTLSQVHYSPDAADSVMCYPLPMDPPAAAGGTLVQNGHGWAEPPCGPEEGGKNDA